jgi:hypothetical protein
MYGRIDNENKKKMEYDQAKMTDTDHGISFLASGTGFCQSIQLDFSLIYSGECSFVFWLTQLFYVISIWC